MSAIEEARAKGLLAKHAPTLAYHKQEPYWASSPAVMTDCALEGRYATYLQSKNGTLIAQAGQSLVRPQLNLAFLNDQSYGRDIPQKPSADDYLNAHGARVSAFYTSNFEFYLFEHGGWNAFAANVATLPRHRTSVFIRAQFDNGARQGSSRSTTELDLIGRVMAEYHEGRIRSYADIFHSADRESAH